MSVTGYPKQLKKELVFDPFFQNHFQIFFAFVNFKLQNRTLTRQNTEIFLPQVFTQNFQINIQQSSVKMSQWLCTVIL